MGAGTLSGGMPKALSPRPSGRRHPPTQTVHALPGDVVNELNRVARSGKARQATARLERAVELLERGDSRGAMSEARKAKDLAPRSVSVREVLGMALYRQGRWREATTELQAYRRMSGRADQNHLIADAERALGRPERAVPLAEEALAGKGVPIEAKAESVIVAASALADMGRYDQALGLLRRIRTRDEVARPEVLRVWYVIADILERAGRPTEAAEQFRKIMRHDPGAYDVAERIAQLG
jgi:tetratricopeptide (TPR) repeat protein